MLKLCLWLWQKWNKTFMYLEMSWAFVVLTTTKLVKFAVTKGGKLGQLCVKILSSRLTWLIAICLATITILLFKPNLLGFLLVWVLNPVVLVWVIVLAIFVCVKTLLPEAVEHKKKLIRTDHVLWIPIIGAMGFTLFHIASVVIPKFSQFVKWIAIAAIILVVVYFLRKYATKKLVVDLAKKSKTDMVAIGLSMLGIVSMNLLVWLTTNVRPEIWQWYWGNQTFFWAWNAGWVVVAFLGSKRDTEGKVIPATITIRKYVRLALFIGFLVNLSPLWFNFWENHQEAKQKEAAEKIQKSALGLSFDEVPTVVAFPFIADCESGDNGKLGTGKQFEIKSGKIVVVQGRVDKDDIGYLQINRREHADLLGKHSEINIAKSKEDNIKFGEILHSLQGYQPWYKTKACWGPKLVSVGYNGYNRESVRSASSGIIQFGPPYNRDLIGDHIRRLDAFGDNFRKPEERREDYTPRIEKASVYYGHVIPVPKDATGVYLDDEAKNTRKFTARFNALTEVDFPLEKGAESKIPQKIEFFQLKSREPDDLIIKVSFKRSE